MSTSSTAEIGDSSQRRKTALAIVKGYNEWSMSSIMAVRSPNCIHEVLPKSLGRPPMDNDTYKAYFSAMIPYFRKFTVTINDIIEDEKENKVVVWARSTADADIGPYANEYMLVFYMNEAADKIDRFLEFVDSNNSVQFFPKLRKHIAEKAGVTEEN